MKLHAKGTKPESDAHKCEPCDLPPSCRNNYFTGKLLTARDLTGEQRYFIDKLRLHHLALHGWGVVCGLKVKPHPHCPDQRIIVEPGMAIDTCGREIRLLEEVELKLPQPEPKPYKQADKYNAQSYKGEGYADKGEGYADKGEGYADKGEGYDEPSYSEQQEGKDYDEPSQEQPEYEEKQNEYEPENPYLTLYICLSYAECESELMPAPFDECACTSGHQQANRICETYHLEILTEEPEGWDRIKHRHEACEQDDCRTLYDSILDSCPVVEPMACLPLAVISEYAPGKAVTEEMIDNRTYRPLLPNTYLLDQLIRCILDKLPTKKLTQIENFDWTHRNTYHCHEFMRQFIGDENERRAFKITFSRPVHKDGITQRTFQAVVVRFADKGGGAGRPEIAPANVRLSKDGLRAHLEIDRYYAQQYLDNANFDLYIQLRCDFVLDQRGDPVDGELLARLDEDGNYIVDAPTGNNVPGGLFESWIRVRTEIKNY